MKTRDRIIERAIDMFNEKGAANVRTVQLSEALGISPGNLYYYFINKEHLIRSIFEEEIMPNTDMLFMREDLSHSENGILKFFKDYTKAIYRYRFFYAETYAMLITDPELLEIYNPRCENLKERLMTAVDSWVETGIIEEITDTMKEFLVENLWTVGQTWPHYIEIVKGEHDPEKITKETVLHYFTIISPYLTVPARNRMIVLLKKKGFAGEHNLDDMH
ncbi:MAG: TetR/AcrR family transcriptional regulator [Anaerovoracaceae bacterium]|nr:TetR/AcrR family transcriptional regulator [Anaerovoracaceae bacterium]